MKTILLGLNELNFDYVRYYTDKGLLPNFKLLLDKFKLIETTSENKYELLEPWIQWTTLHTGKTFKEHKIFRLGDIVDSDEEQIFESIEAKGIKVGAVSPFNAKNNLKNPAFFIPDPWTKTKVSGNWFIDAIYKAIHQSVNDNASGKLKFSTLITLASGLIRIVPPSRYGRYLKYFLKIGKPGVKAIILDTLLADVFIFLFNKNKPGFSNLFLNTGAHIQHHYLFNSDAYKGNLKNPEWYCENGYDPFITILKLYDDIIGKLLKLEVNLFVATGLHQQPHKDLTFYWRINKHEDFVNKISLDGILKVLPRMSRDFLIEFTNKEKTTLAEKILNSFYLKRDGKKLFNVDNRGKSLFVELVYSSEVMKDDTIVSKKYNLQLSHFKKYISFVAIKNGEHNGLGYFAFNPKHIKEEVEDKIELKEVKGIIERSVFNINK